MSTAQQLQGASLARQLEQSQAYADEHDWELDNSLRDIGVSAFTGKNVTDGALGQFISMCQGGKIEKGSVLIVESLDRITRQRPLDAFNIFTNILRHGVEIVTLTDRKHYTEDSVNANIADLYISIGVMVRANEESEIKALRLKDAWNRKREKAGDEKITSMCPRWLKLSDNKKSFIVIEERATVIRMIFDMMNNGFGFNKILTRLNSEKIPPFGKSKGWYGSTIRLICTSGAVIGEFQPHTKVNGKRVTIGEPIKDYYPAIVSEETYYKAQAARSSRRISGAGRKGKTFSNLFTGIAKCAVCGASLNYKFHGSDKARGHGKYLVCYNSHRGVCENKKHFPYQKFEDGVLAHLHELSVQDLLSEQKSEESQIRSAIVANQAKLDSVTGKRSKLILEFAGGDGDETIKNIIDDLGKEEFSLKDMIVNQKKLLKRTCATKEDTDNIIDNIWALSKNVAGQNEERTYEIRAAINAEIRKIVRVIECGADGLVTMFAEQTDTHRWLDMSKEGNLLDGLYESMGGFDPDMQDLDGSVPDDL